MKKDFILVIKHGSLGDIVLATGPMAAIRRHHPDAYIVCLTTRPYVETLAHSPYFDEVWLDRRIAFWKGGDLWRLLRMFRHYPFTRVYDLQTSKRSSFYFRLFPNPKPEWSGIAEGASHRHDTPHRIHTHTIERQKEQLAIAGITDVPSPDVGWLRSDIAKFFSSPPGEGYPNYALLVPGGSAHRPEKRWPKERYAELAAWLIEQGITPVLIGTEAEREVLEFIEDSGIRSQESGKKEQRHPEPKAKDLFSEQVLRYAQDDENSLISDPRSPVPILNLCSRTSFADIAELARHAVLAVGNDTGPMHLIAATGCPSIVLFSGASNPDLCAPRGAQVKIMKKQSLSELSLNELLVNINN